MVSGIAQKIAPMISVKTAENSQYPRNNLKKSYQKAHFTIAKWGILLPLIPVKADKSFYAVHVKELKLRLKDAGNVMNVLIIRYVLNVGLLLIKDNLDFT